MFKKRFFAVSHDFKTGFLCKLSIVIGIIFLIIFLFLKTVSFFLTEGSEGILNQIYELSQSTIPDSMIALSIILIFIGIVLYFFNCQFSKLEKIEEEIENGEDLEK
jgi:ABC-type spermidine/putrescine transport system permease subunit II